MKFSKSHRYLKKVNSSSVYDVADRVVLINEGEIAYNGSPENIKKQENNIIRQFVLGDSTI